MSENIWHSQIPGSLTGNLAEGLKLSGTYCAKCGKSFFPKRRNCPYCMDEEKVSSVALKSTGKLHSYIITQAAPPGFPVPHAQGYVILDDSNIKLFTLLTDYDADKLKTGCAMEVKVIEVKRNENNEPVYTYRFKPVA